MVRHPNRITLISPISINSLNRTTNLLHVNTSTPFPINNTATATTSLRSFIQYRQMRHHKVSHTQQSIHYTSQNRSLPAHANLRRRTYSISPHQCRLHNHSQPRRTLHINRLNSHRLGKLLNGTHTSALSNHSHNITNVNLFTKRTRHLRHNSSIIRTLNNNTSQRQLLRLPSRFKATRTSLISLQVRSRNTNSHKHSRFNPRNTFHINQGHHNPTSNLTGNRQHTRTTAHRLRTQQGVRTRHSINNHKSIISSSIHRTGATHTVRDQQIHEHRLNGPARSRHAPHHLLNTHNTRKFSRIRPSIRTTTDTRTSDRRH